MGSKARRSRNGTAVVGAADHCGWAVLVTVVDGALIDRRRVELIDDSLPKLPHHHECQALAMHDALDLVERVRASANEHAAACLDALQQTLLAVDVPATIIGIALRECPALPPTVAERITNYRAQNVADSVMYRDALAKAAESRRWFVFRYRSKTVFEAAAEALRQDTVDALLKAVGKSLGPPWRKDHRVAMAAAIAAAATTR